MSLMQDYPELLRKALAVELPGHSAFLAHTGYDKTRLQKALERDKEPRISAVLVALYPKNGTWHSVLMKRPAYDGVHSGQIAFPGGRKEKEDVSLMATALREFEEETGSTTADFEILGAMSQLYIPPSRSLVTPFVAVCKKQLLWDPDPIEVAALIETPFSDLLAPNILKTTEQLIWALGKELPVPYFDIQNEIVWGATALMVAELRQLLGTDFL